MSFDAPSSDAFALLSDFGSDNDVIYDTETLSFISERCNKLIHDENLDEEWFPIILKYTSEAIRRIWPNVRYNNDSMNINKYLRI
jgi:hypothetical protein